MSPLLSPLTVSSETGKSTPGLFHCRFQGWDRWCEVITQVFPYLMAEPFLLQPEPSSGQLSPLLINISAGFGLFLSLEELEISGDVNDSCHDFISSV